MSSNFLRQFNLLADFPKDDLLYAMYPLYRICRLCGVCPLELKFQSNHTAVFKLTTNAVLQSMMVLVLMTIGFIVAVISLETVHSYSKYEHNFISVFTAWGQVYALYTVAFLGIISANIKRHQKVEVYRVLRSIDKRLVELGSIVNYTNSRRNLLYAMAAFSSMPLVFSMVNCGVINSNYDAFVLCYIFICFFPMLIICLKEFQYYNLILFVEKNLEEVNRHLRRMATPIVKAFPQGVAFSVTKYDQTCRDTVCELKKLSGIYTDLIDAGRKIQDIFGLHLLLIISTSFMVLTIQTYILFSLIMKIIEMSPFRIFSSLSWMLVQSFAIVMNIHVCSKASKAMANTGPLLHNIQSLSDNRSVFQTAQMFSLQILHRNISFTAAGFFNLDYKLITSIVAAVTTYLVIIIQFHLANQQSLNLAAAGSRLNLTSN